MNDEQFDPDAPTLDVEFFRAGGSKLSDSEREILGEVQELRILVSPEGSGDEVLSLINLGAAVTLFAGGPSIVPIVDAATELGLELHVISGQFGELLPDEIRGQLFDVVYSPWGTLDGLADLDGWAADVAEVLAPGGHLVAYDEHPVSFMLKEQQGDLVVGTSYWGEFIHDNNDGEPDESGGTPATFGWAIGDLVTALGDNGLATMRIEEFQESDRYMTSLQLIESVTDEQRELVPSALLLVARKL